jgi:nucleoside-diphosphate-sugar epimerase
MKYSIFGGSGFVGNNFISMYNDESIIISRDSNKPESDNILYFISTVDNYNVHTDPYLDINTNLIKLINVLEECKKINNPNFVFNFISSWFVYGKTNDLPANENSICNPTGFYSITKRAAEQLLISYCQTFNIKYRILRLTNIIGIDDKKISKKKNALQYMINLLKENKEINLYDGGTHIRDYMDVVDACRAINICIKNAPLNEIINISNSEPYSISELIHYAYEKLDSKSKINSISPTQFHKIVQIENMYLDNTKLLSYGYYPTIKVKESIDKLLK